MAQRAGGPFGRIELLGTRDRMDRGSRIRPLDRDEALRLLRGGTLDSETVEIRRWWFEQGFSTKRTDRELLAAIAEAAYAGRIALAYRRMIVSGWSTGDGASLVHDQTAREPNRPVRSIPALRPEWPTLGSALPPSSGATEVKTWIEFRLLDESTGKPVSGVGFRIELPNGSIVNRTTDGTGKIRIDGIDPGVCGIREIVADTGPEVTNVM